MLMSTSAATCLNSFTRRAAAWSLTVLIWATAAISIATIGSPSARGQSLQPPNTSQSNWHLGYNGFRMLLEERGLVPRVSLEATLTTPSESVVVLFGDLSGITRDEWLQMRRFVAQGGRLLVASERAFRLPGVTQFFPGPVKAINSADKYEGFDDCITLSSLDSAHPLTKGLRNIIVNKSGWLSPAEDRSLAWETVASLPIECRPAAAQGRPVLMAGRDPVSNGLLILSADQSLFSDGMLWHGDNSILAIQTSDLLCEGQRRWLTVYENGRTLPGYRQNAATPPVRPPVTPPQIPPNVEPPEPDLKTMLKIANKVVDEVQQSNILNETLKERPRNLSPVAWLRTLFLILLILLTLYVLWRLTQNRSHLQPDRHSRFLQSMYGVHSAKQMEASEFGSAVEILSRALCQEITGSPVETDWIRLIGNEKGSGVSRLPKTLRKRLVELVGIATRGCRIHISRRKFQTIGETIQQVRLLHRQNPIVPASPLVTR